MSIPNIDTLLETVDSKYTLSILIAKRSRELADYFHAKRDMERTTIVGPLIETETTDPLEVAFREVEEKKISYIRVKDGIK